MILVSQFFLVFLVFLRHWLERSSQQNKCRIFFEFWLHDENEFAICHHWMQDNAGAKFQQQTNHCNVFSPTRLWRHVTVSVSGVERAEEVSAVLLSKAPWVAPPCVRCCTALGVRSMSSETTAVHQLTVCCRGSCCRVAHPWPISMHP